MSEYHRIENDTKLTIEPANLVHHCEACKAKVTHDAVKFFISDFNKPDGVLCLSCWMHGCIWATKKRREIAGPGKEDSDA